MVRALRVITFAAVIGAAALLAGSLSMTAAAARQKAPAASEPVPWEVLSVSPSQRTLRIGYTVASCAGANVHVDETKASIRLTVRRPLARPGIACIEQVRTESVLVGLSAPVAGRRLSGPVRGLGALAGPVGPGMVPGPVRVPRVVGLRGLDARRALAVTGLRTRFAGNSEHAVTAQKPGAARRARAHATVTLTMAD
ncbi:MAG TPA: hypothetical protein VHZ75_11410 [Solirubrobacteraceae bacterium]|jgi:hypothetical protein|nr:hypothetical protein [Solirubrobacteraceae bacterium]